MTETKRRPAAACVVPLLALAGASLSATGCASYFMDQAKVPGTDKRIAVGHDGWPFKKAWVWEDGKWHKIKVVHAK